jgi:hypothetical protein
VREALLDIRAGIKAGRYVNEATVSQGIVQRLLNALGWPVYDTEVVAPDIPNRLFIFLEPVNPGISKEGRVVYEVPPDAEGFVLMLDDVELLEDKTARYDLSPLPSRAYG